MLFGLDIVGTQNEVRPLAYNSSWAAAGLCTVWWRSSCQCY
jgi:hypothetical protein